jgi:hypothetical protein
MAVFVVEFYGGQVLAIQSGCIEFHCSGFHQVREILKGLRRERQLEKTIYQTTDYRAG